MSIPTYQLNGVTYCTATGKRRFRSKQRARAVKKSVHLQGRDHGVLPQRAYLCEWCGGYHLTSMKEKPKKAP